MPDSWTTQHMIAPADDRRHTPGPGAKPLWNESWWFPFYDPETRIGVVTRIGLLPMQQAANLWFFVTRDGALVHDATNLALPLPEGDIDTGLQVGALSYRCLEPLARWRLAFEDQTVQMDVEWQAFSPVHQWPFPPGSTVEDVPRHLEQSGWARGTLRLGRERITLARAYGHRDHSWGGERDWSKMHHWYYASGEMGADLSFNAVKVWFAEDVFITIGCLWDGRETLHVEQLDVVCQIDRAARHQTAGVVTVHDSRGRDWRFDGTVLAHCPVQIGPTLVDDAITEFRSAGRVGYGVIEYGRQE